MNHYAEIEHLLESGAHFGHLTRRWNPKMEKYIFGERNGIHIIDLRKTQILIDLARNAVNDAASRGKIVLFVGTKTQAQEVVKEHAKRCGSNYVTERWLGGMLTNFSTIRKSIKRLASIDKMEVDGTFEKITKKEHIAVKEAKILDIPVIAMVDTNCDPEDADFPIPANDDSIKTIEIVTKILADAVLEGSELAKMRHAELSSESERVTRESEAGSEDKPKVQRRMRERRTGRGGQKTQRGDKPRTTEAKEPTEIVEEQTSSETTVETTQESIES